MRCCEKSEFQAGLAMQAYLKSGVEDAKRICDWAKRTGRIVTVRLVKGAYWDYETINAEQQGWPCPVWAEKWQTDACFEQMVEVFLDALPPHERSRGRREARARLAQRALHRARSPRWRSAASRANAIELQMLHGMADQLKYAAADMGLRVREYVPVGEMIPGMAYLVRRLLENTSNESWLKAGFLDNADSGVLLRAPRPKAGGGAHDPSPTWTSWSRRAPPALARREGVGDGARSSTSRCATSAKRAQREAFARRDAGATVPEGRQRPHARAGQGHGRSRARGLPGVARHRPAGAGEGARQRGGRLMRSSATGSPAS
jgi:hypothetical protein